MNVDLTPGPWEMSRERYPNGTAATCIYQAKTGVEVALCQTVFKVLRGQEFEYLDANAKLITAAPDLLAALQGVLRVADRATTEFDAARAAIVKAIGCDNKPVDQALARARARAAITKSAE